jgi:YYY domain-containing protein
MWILGIVFLILFSIIISQIFPLKYYASRPFSILILSLLAFVLSFLMPFKTAFLISSVFMLVTAAVMLWKRRKLYIDESEAVFLIFFIYFFFLRSLVPDAIGAEKLMDIAFLNSVIHAGKFPPPDPFFAGGTLNFYYYFGYVIGAVTTMLSLSPPEIGFNISLAYIAALSFSTVYGLLKELMDSRKFAGAGTVIMLFSGNLYAAKEFFENLMAGKTPGFLFYWNATRVIDDATYGKTINEFPYFSFIHADLHAHVFAIPLKLLTLALLYAYLKDRKKGYFLIPALFSLFASNSWDFPIFFMLTFLVAVLRVRKDEKVVKLTKNPKKFEEIKTAVAILGLSAVASLLLFSTMEVASARPFIISERSNSLQFFQFWGLHLLLAYCYHWREWKIVLASFIFSILFIPILPIAPLLIPLMVVSLRRLDDFPSLLAFVFSLIVLATEFFAIESRMNTFFKFYLAAWILLSVPAALAFKDFWENRNLRPVATVILALMLVYPAIATPVRHYKADFNLDGMEFVRIRSLGDYEAIRWLRGAEQKIVLEAAGDCYGYGGRIAAFAAKQTVVAWQCHEVQWRGNGEELARRIAEVRAIYTSGNCSVVLFLLQKYNVSYVVVGSFEREMYGVKPDHFEKCGLKKVFESGETVIYKVLGFQSLGKSEAGLELNS